MLKPKIISLVVTMMITLIMVMTMIMMMVVMAVKEGCSIVTMAMAQRLL